MSLNNRETYNININFQLKEKKIIINKEDDNVSEISLNNKKKNKLILNINNCELRDDLEIIININNKEYEIFKTIEKYEKLQFNKKKEYQNNILLNNNINNNNKSIQENNKSSTSSNEINEKNNDKDKKTFSKNDINIKKKSKK